MQLGFVSAILPDLSLEQVFEFAKQEGFGCVELMCWPVGAADRRYAGVTHLDVASLDADKARYVNELSRKNKVTISGLGYYPNPLAADADHRRVVSDHIGKVIDGAKLLGIGVVNTFIGRDHTMSIAAQWHLVEEVWKPLLKRAET